MIKSERLRKKPKEWYINHHRTMWNWLADNPEKSKKDWPGWNRFKNEYWKDCFLCQYTHDYGYSTSRGLNCNFCPLRWPYGEECYYTIFSAWSWAAVPEDKTRLARQIAELPER